MEVTSGNVEFIEYAYDPITRKTIVKTGLDLVNAIEKGDLDFIKNMVSKQKLRFFEYEACIESENFGIVKYMCDMDHIDELFLAACRFGDFDMVRYLVNEGADINSKYYPLAYAVESYDITKFLVENGGDLTADANMAYGANLDHIEMIDLLLANGISKEYLMKTAVTECYTEGVDYLTTV